MTHYNEHVLDRAVHKAKSTGLISKMPGLRKPKVKLTVTINYSDGGVIPQVILIPGETRMHELDEAVRKAVIEQTVHDGSNIMRVSYQP